MASDHATKQEDPVPNSSSGSSGGERDEILWEKRHHEEDCRDTAATVLDDEEAGPPNGMLPMERTHTHRLGMLTLRAEDDDDPS
jgi:hypothetical protein